MTWFEDFAKRLGVLKIDKNGRYTGLCESLYYISLDILLSDDDSIRNLTEEEQEKMIIKEFYRKYPYAEQNL